jgi:glycosyltransferase involved in cell wall biosynthesis
MLIDFIIPTYNRINSLRSMLSSLIAQTNDSWRANVVIDDIDNNDIVTLINNLSCKNIRYTITGKRYNDFGHTPREIGKQMSECQYIIMTGDDNYYVPVFVNEVINISGTNPSVIYWDAVHSHYDYKYFNSIPAYNQIDMGAFATRRDVAQSIKLNTTYAADGEYIETIKKDYPNERMIKIDKVLFIHN